MSAGGWIEDHYLFLNDEDSKNATSGSCEGCTRHEFKLTNKSSVAQKAYIQIHTWNARSYAFEDPDCYRWWHFYKLNLPGSEQERPKAFHEIQQVIHEMKPGEELTGYVELDWTHSQASHAKDWSIVTYAKTGKVEITLTDLPNRPSDRTVGYYAAGANS